jgi:ATP-dependent Clp protease ATP-binding subunit ClpX
VRCVASPSAASARETGARALRAVMEEIMLDLMYDLPEMNNEGTEYLIDEDFLVNPGSLTRQKVERKESA